MDKADCGVIYSDEDYVGFWRRILIIIFDLVVMVPILFLGYVADLHRYEVTLADNFIFYQYFSISLCYLYMTVLKSSRIGTLGQIVTKSKIVTLKGKRPNVFQMSFRLWFWLFGPINFIFDLAFMQFNSEKRTFRDCTA